MGFETRRRKSRDRRRFKFEVTLWDLKRIFSLAFFDLTDVFEVTLWDLKLSKIDLPIRDSSDLK